MNNDSNIVIDNEQDARIPSRRMAEAKVGGGWWL